MTTKEENIRLIFGLKLRQLRMEKNLSLSDVSKASGISISYLNEIEKGKKYPKANKIAQMAKALDVSYDWLVSLQLTQNLSPIAELVKSDLLTNLPLEIFGIELGDLMDLVSNTPSKISAFISTLIELARNYNIGVENFYFSVLRSYQEMHENYFEDLEETAEQFTQAHPELGQLPIGQGPMRQILAQSYHYEVEEFDFGKYPALKSLRTVLLPGRKPRLLINANLNDTQKRFALGRELGYCFMKIQQRAYTSSWIKIESFEQLLNNFKASYFSGALLIPRQAIVSQIRRFITYRQWREDKLLGIIETFQASPEMFAHRLTGIVPKFFGLNQLFFLRFIHQKSSDWFQLDKELHLAGLYNPHGNMLSQHYCRRWVSLNILKDLDALQNQAPGGPELLIQAQRSQYFDSENEFFCISLARPVRPARQHNHSVTIGFLMNEAFKKQVHFWNDAKIPVRKVGVTCERCSAADCAERVAAPLIYDENKRIEKIQEGLSQLKKDFGV
ncbi:MAG: hypothetical protein OHK0053_21890 [Microscillaceae bacterium]